MRTFPYIRIQQRGEIFFLTKIPVSYLQEKVDLHFRDPYFHVHGEYRIKNEEYLQTLRKRGIELETDNEEGVQRRLQFARIMDIKKYVDENVSNFFPNSVLISADTTSDDSFDDDEYLGLESNEIGHFRFSDQVRLSVIDGQHRLAGLFQAEHIDKNKFEIPVVLLLNAGLPIAAKLFSDINGKQKPVSRSHIYELYEYVDDESVSVIKKYHLICQKFYTDAKSPLYRQIKMLGLGGGSISQSFFIDMAARYVEPQLKDYSLQDSYTELFYYFRAFQKTFPEDWPVPLPYENEKQADEHAEMVLKNNRSQLLKTNGFGAIMRAFPTVFSISNGNFDKYLTQVQQLQKKVTWRRSEMGQVGGGAAMQNHIYKQINGALS